jgi:acyl-CoA synthetase (NDP forming)
LIEQVIQSLLNPRRVAVIGASGDPGKTAGRPIHYLQRHGYGGAIYPVNPKAQTLAGLPCFAEVDALPEAPDVGIVVLGIERAEQAVRALARRGAAAAIVIGSGYAEVGEEGRARQQRLLEAAEGMRVLGPNTIGLVNLTDRIVLSASGALEMPSFTSGPIALVSQSGGILGSLLSRAAARGIGFSKLICTGNEADLDLADLVLGLADDPATQVIALYIEGIRRPDVFRAAARRARAAGKAIVAFKVGRSEAGARAAVSHTGALAGRDDRYQALFDELGIIRAERFSDLLDIASVLSTGRTLVQIDAHDPSHAAQSAYPDALASPPAGRNARVAILTSTGGAGTLLADSLGACGLETPPPDPACAARLRALQPGEQAVFDRNPIDVTLAGLQPDLLRAALRALLASPIYDALLVVVGSSALARPELMADAIREVLPESAKPVLAYLSPHAPQVGRVLEAAGVPAFSEPETCASVLQAMQKKAFADFLLSRLSTDQTVHGNPASASLDAANLPMGVLDESQSRAVFDRIGIRSVPERVVRSASEAAEAAQAMGKRVVLKVLASEWAHKTEVGGVAIDLRPDEVAAAFSRMQAQVLERTGRSAERFLVQPMLSGGVEMLLGLTRDELGWALVMGHGGVRAELERDSAVCLLPEAGVPSRARIETLLRGLRCWPLFEGFRGTPPFDLEAFINAAQAMARLPASLGARLVEAEINPLIVMPEGEGVWAVDGMMVLA